jgi:hypothetical protein
MVLLSVLKRRTVPSGSITSRSTILADIVDRDRLEKEVKDLRQQGCVTFFCAPRQ